MTNPDMMGVVRDALQRSFDEHSHADDWGVQCVYGSTLAILAAAVTAALDDTLATAS